MAASSFDCVRPGLYCFRCPLNECEREYYSPHPELLERVEAIHLQLHKKRHTEREQAGRAKISLRCRTEIARAAFNIDRARNEVQKSMLLLYVMHGA